MLQPHDVLAECQKISLDPMDYVKEEAYFDNTTNIATVDDSAQQPSLLESSISSLLKLNSIFSGPDKSHNTSANRRTDTKTQNKLSSDALENVCNPSELCNMVTPPSSRPISPSNSAHDLTTARHPVSSDIEYGADGRGSMQSLNGQADRKSLSDSHNYGTLYNAISNENVNQKNILLKSLMSSTQSSTPAEKDSFLVSRKSTPLSPRRSSSYKNPKNRPISSEFFKSRLGNSGHFDYHSAPTSPMVPPNPATSQNHFSFNTTTESETDSSRITDENFNGKGRSASPETAYKADMNLANSLKQLVNETNQNNREQCDMNFDSSYSFYSQQQQQILHSRSPVQVLDDYIQYGTDLHSLLISK